MFDYKYYNDVAKEEKCYIKEIAKEKNRILRMSDTKRKQEQWSKLFPKMEQTTQVF